MYKYIKADILQIITLTNGILGTEHDDLHL